MRTLLALGVAVLLAVAGCYSGGGGKSALPTLVRLTIVGGGHGSGVPLSPTWVLTCRHVLPVAEASGSEVVQIVEHPSLDLALIRVKEPRDWRPAEIAEAPPRYSDPLVAIGWQLGDFLVPTDGRQGFEPWLMSCPVIFGASGGAVLDADNKLVGIIEAVTMLNNGPLVSIPLSHLSHYIPVVELRTWILDHVKDQKSSK